MRQFALSPRFLASVGLFMLLSGSALAAGGHTIDYDNLHINWWGWDDHAPPVGWFMVNFVLFISLLVYFTKRPISEALKERSIGIKQAIESADKAYQGAKESHANYQSKNEGLEEEISTLKEDSKQAGMKERDTRIKAAKDYAERMRGDAQKVIDQELDKAHVRLKNVVAQKALNLAEEWIRSGLSDEDRQVLAEDAILALESGVGQASVAAKPSTEQGAQL